MTVTSPNDNNLPVRFADCVEFKIPKFDTRPEIPLPWNNIAHAEQRLVEAKIVNGATYAELEYVYNEGYREAVKHMSVVGYEITKAEKHIRALKSQFLIDEYPDFLKEKKLKDNTANREAFLERQESYTDAMDRLAMLQALQTLLEGKIKVFTNVCRYMRKEMDIQLRSGIINSNKCIR